MVTSYEIFFAVPNYQLTVMWLVTRKLNIKSVINFRLGTLQSLDFFFHL